MAKTSNKITLKRKTKQPTTRQAPRVTPNVREPPVLRQPRPNHTSQVCSITDPFCEHARSGRYPDSNGARSLSYPVRRMFSIATGATGVASYLIAPNYLNNWEAPASGIAGNVATFGNPYAAASVIAAATNVRLVSWGLRIKHVTTPLTASGMVYVRGYASQSGTSYLGVDMTTMNADVIANIPLQDCADVAIIGKRANTTSQFYASPASTLPSGAAGITLYNGMGWDSYVISVIGGPASTSCLVVELIQNWEIVIDDNDTSAQLMLAPPPANALVTKAAAVVTSTAETVFLRGVSAASTYVKRLATTALLGYFGGPPAARMAMLVD